MPHSLTITRAAAEIRAGRLSPLELLQACLAQIDALDSRLHAWVNVDRRGAEQCARRLQEELARGRYRGPLHGIPVGIKDIINVNGLPTTAGARELYNRVPKEDATVVERLRTSGAVILGKTVTTPFACFDPAETRNPWNPDHTPGGSSSGSAAAVAARMCPAALGSQTGGSISRPAAYCGLVGLKPTFGRISLRWNPARQLRTRPSRSHHTFGCRCGPHPGDRGRQRSQWIRSVQTSLPENTASTR